jgi:hypothetical protein
MVDYAAHAHFSDYTPADFGWDARDPEADPSLLVPFSYAGVSFGSMHRDVVNVFRALLDELVPLIPGGLVDGQCGCYNPSSVTVGGQRSFHTYAIAIDINWGENRMGANQHPTGPHTLPSATSAIARKYGCEWGGDWTNPQDWMHIEVQLSPADARSFTSQPSAPTPSTPIAGEDDDMYVIFGYKGAVFMAPLGYAYKRGFKNKTAVLQWEAATRALGAKYIAINPMDPDQAASIPTGATIA